MTVKKLKQKKSYLEDQLYELHYLEASPKMYMQRRSQLEYDIAALEEAIEFEERMKPFRTTLKVAIVIVISITIYYLIHKYGK